MSEYKISFYIDRRTGRKPAQEYINSLDEKDYSKVKKFIDILVEHNGHIDEPYSRHIIGKIRELRVSLGHNRHRIFYFTFVDKNIVLLSAFLKHTDKTPQQEIVKALQNYHDLINNPNYYEYFN